MSNFPERLKLLRENKGVSQRELAKLISVAPSTIAMWETNERKPDLDTLNTIADFFDVSTDYLLGRTDNSKPVDSTSKNCYQETPIETQIAANMEAKYGEKPSPQLVELIREVIQEELDKKNKK